MKTSITKETQDLIIHYFLTNKDNRISVVAKECNVSLYMANKVIDKYLESKKNK